MISDIMYSIGINARSAAKELAKTSTEIKNQALLEAADFMCKSIDVIKEANSKDMKALEEKGASKAMLDRLYLDDDRIRSIADGIRAIAELPDPVGKVTEQWDRPSGINISRVKVPLGVIGIIYESRPNVTADAGALCLKSGNAAILRGGSESFFSSSAIMECLSFGLKKVGINEKAIQMIPVTDREAVGIMLKMSEYIDIIVPRGGKSLIQRVSEESRIPLFKHLEGICHTYIHEAADKDKAVKVVLNAKMRRTGICNTTETLLVDKSVYREIIPSVIDTLSDAGCEVRGDSLIQELDKRVVAATEEDWDTEYLDSIISVKVTENIEDAIEHIYRHSSGHTESIITENKNVAEKFLAEVDSAIVMHNTSTQFSDGGEFGMGAEIGISTGKIHARGPVGLEQLTSFKYQVRSNGVIRPL